MTSQSWDEVKCVNGAMEGGAIVVGYGMGVW